MDSTLPVREIRKAGVSRDACLKNTSATMVFMLTTTCLLLVPQKETLSRLENIAPATVELFSVIIQRICLTVLNKEVVSELIRNLGGATENRQESGELLRSISLVYPSIFEDHLGDMISLLRDREATGGTTSRLCNGSKHFSIQETNDHFSLTCIASDTLHTLAGFAKQFARSLPADSQSKEVIQSFLEAGTILQATHATIVLASIKDNEDMCQEIAQVSCQRMTDI